MRPPLVALALLAPALAGCVGDPAAPGGAPADSPYAWSFVDTDGVERTNASAEGAPAMIFFMASWCGTCRSKAPMLAEVFETYAPRNLSAFTVSFEPRDDAGDLQAWKERYGHAWPHGVDEGLRMARHFDVASQSSVVVLDAEGDVVRKWGYPGPTRAGLEEALEAAFA